MVATGEVIDDPEESLAWGCSNFNCTEEDKFVFNWYDQRRLFGNAVVYALANWTKSTGAVDHSV
uniref:Uncharacterized protein n=1 Tax=Oryza nivara TaxID=4536 RepID=A0A0E0FLY9_ORYNI